MLDKLHWCRGFKITEHKYCEIQLSKWQEWQYFDLHISLTRKTDHAGFTFDLEILGLNFILTIYDHRHWDDKLDRWVTQQEIDERPHYFD